eukprot:403374097
MSQLTFKFQPIPFFHQSQSSQIQVMTTNNIRLHRILYGLSIFFIGTYVFGNLIQVVIQLLNDQDTTGIFQAILVSALSQLVLWFSTSLLIVYIKTNGSPYKSSLHQENLKYLSTVYAIWSVAFLLKTGFIAATMTGALRYNSPLYFVSLASMNLTTDIVPYLTILEFKFIELFKKQQKEAKYKSNLEEVDNLNTAKASENNLVHDLEQPKNKFENKRYSNQFERSTHINHNFQINEQDGQYIDLDESLNSDERLNGEVFNRKSLDKLNPQIFSLIPENVVQQNLNTSELMKNSNAIHKIEQEFEINSHNSQILEICQKPWFKQQQQKKTKLGVFHKATFNKEIVIARVLNFDRVTTYVINDYLGQLARLNQIKMAKHTLFPLGITFDE